MHMWTHRPGSYAIIRRGLPGRIVACVHRSMGWHARFGRIGDRAGILCHKAAVAGCAKDVLRMNVRRIIPTLSAICLLVGAQAQCPQLYDYNGVPSPAPEWYSCSGTNFTLLIATPQTVGAFTVDWGDGSPLYNGAALMPPMSVSHVYTAAVATYTVTFTELATGCVIVGTVTMEQSTSASIQIPVGGLTQVCAPHPVDFINSSTNVSPNTVFTWDFGDGSPILTFDHTNWLQTVTHMYEQGTVDCETTVTLTAQNTCNMLQGGASVATFNPIRIWDIDDAAITPSATLLCWPDNEVTYLNTTERNCFQQGNIFQRYEYWNFGDYWGTGQDSIIDWTPWPPTFPQTIAYPGIGTYEVMLLDSNYCGIDTAIIQITIVPPPTVALSADPLEFCAGETVHFDATTNGGANFFQWDFGTGNGFQNTGAGDQAFTYGTPGTYTISYAASIQGATAGCADTASVTIDVLPSPTAAFTVDNDAACDQLTVLFTNTSVGGIDFHWDFGDGTTSDLEEPPPHDYNVHGSYQVTLTVTNGQGCTDQATHMVHVYQPPQVDIGAQNVCLGAASQFFDLTSTEPGNSVISWSWDLGDGNTSVEQSPVHTYGTAGPYTVTMTATTPYCSGIGSIPIVVEAPPVAAFTSDVVYGCSPMTVSFNNTSVGAASATWTFGDGAGTNTWDASHTYLNLGAADSTFTVQLVVTTAFGCTDTLMQNITVAPAVNAMFTHNGQPGCAPMAVTFTNNSTGAGSYAWDFGDGETSTAFSPQHTYVNTSFFLDIHTVTLIATSPAGCSDTASMTIMVYPTPDFTLVATPDSGCSPLTVTFPSVVGAVTYQWDFGDGATGNGPSPVHTYVNSTTNNMVFNATMVGANAFGCTDTVTTQIVVHPDPLAQFTITDPIGCHPHTAEIVNGSTGADTFNWSYGDGLTSTVDSAIHSHTWNNFAGPGVMTYPITLTVTTDQGCSSTATAEVQVYPAVTAAFVAPDTGCAPLTVPFINVSNGATSYQWFFGDGQFSGATSPTHTYQSQGLDEVAFTPMLVATSAFGCTDTATTVIHTWPQPLAQFIPSAQAGCQPLEVTFQDLSIGATQMLWLFGDGQSQTTGPGNITHIYTNTSNTPVSYDPMLVVTSIHGCTDTAQSTIEVYPPVVAAFAVDTIGCSPLTVDLANLSTGANSYMWDMGEGTLLVNESPTFTYVNTTVNAQIHTITLTATSPFGCVSTTTQDIHVHPQPFAAFQATPFTQQFPDATVNIVNNSSTGPWTHAWTFGDGGSSSAQSPGSHTYGSWGQYTITLVVSGAYCSDTVTQVVEILPPLPNASFLGSGVGCAPLTVGFTNTSFGGLTYQWNFGDGGTSSADNPVYTYNAPGTYTVTLTAFGVGGGAQTVSNVDSVVVYPNAVAYFVIQPNEVVVPSQPVFTYNLSGNATEYFWDFGDGSTYTSFNPVHYYTQGGTYDVMLIANNQWNCPDTFLLESAVHTRVSGDIQFPNAFTPNNSGPGDGSYDEMTYDNDVFFPVYEGVEEYRLEIFNRWGELLFISKDVRKGWDGWYRGQPAKQDVYVWKCFARFSDGRESVLKGDVTLLR